MQTNDAMFVTLRKLYPSVAPSLGDLLAHHWSVVGVRGAAQYDYYRSFVGAQGETWGDLANWYWNDADTGVFNLELEDGNDLLLEDGNLIMLEAGNV